jgi:ABC-type cobalamin/Fe3+-siderophores transport system ATPase subunit
VLLSGGSVLASGTPEEVLTQESMRRVFGVDMEVLTTSYGRRVLVPLALV